MKSYCYKCKKHFHPLGIARHRAMHRDKKEMVRISYPGREIIHDFRTSKKPPK